MGDGYVGLNFGDYKTGKSLFNFGLETTAFGLTGYGMGKGLNNLQFTGRASLRDMVNMGLKKGGITTFTNVGVGTATFIVNMELNNIVNNTENATATPDPAH
ncbi:hypothetical protein BW716_11095 [[Flexibacter] sp. ATCC 35208]|nr:hypothetical protein BW716_11095 [[Flexibacter] sp. ATCC 35208]